MNTTFHHQESEDWNPVCPQNTRLPSALSLPPSLSVLCLPYYPHESPRPAFPTTRSAFPPPARSVSSGRLGSITSAAPPPVGPAAVPGLALLHLPTAEGSVPSETETGLRIPHKNATQDNSLMPPSTAAHFLSYSFSWEQFDSFLSHCHESKHIALLSPE